MTARHPFVCLLLLASLTLYAQDPPGAMRLTNQMMHNNSAYMVCFSPDGQYVLSGSFDNTLKLWNVATGKEVRTLSGHTDRVLTVCFSPDGRYALNGSSDNKLKLWEVSTGKVVRTLSGHTSYINSVCFSPDGRYALSGSSDNILKLWEVSTGEEVSTWKLNYPPVHVSFTVDSSAIRVGTAAYFVSFPLTKTVISRPTRPEPISV